MIHLKNNYRTAIQKQLFCLVLCIASCLQASQSAEDITAKDIRDAHKIKRGTLPSGVHYAIYTYYIMPYSQMDEFNRKAVSLLDDMNEVSNQIRFGHRMLDKTAYVPLVVTAEATWMHRVSIYSLKKEQIESLESAGNTFGTSCCRFSKH